MYSSVVFNEELKIKQRNISAWSADFYKIQKNHQLVAHSLVDRLYDVKRSFPLAVDINCGPGYIAPLLNDREKVSKCILLDPSESLLMDKGPEYYEIARREEQAESRKNGLYTALDEEYAQVKRQVTNSLLDFTSFVDESSVDLALSHVAMHWVNDLEAYLQRVFHILKPDGLFLGAMVGGDSLFELRSSLIHAQQQLAQSNRAAKPGQLETFDARGHISPMVHLGDLGALLTASGFQLVTLDYQEIKFKFSSILEIMKDLSLKGESFCPADESLRAPINKAKLKIAEDFYRANYGESDEDAPDGRRQQVLPVTVQMFYLIGWKPSANTPKPIDRGSHKIKLKDALV